MTTLEDITFLIERGRYEEAMEELATLADPVEQVEALTQLATAVYKKENLLDWALDIIEDAIYLTEKIKDTPTQATLYAKIAATLIIMDYPDDAMNLFNRAIDMVEKIKNPIERGVVLSTIAYYLAVAGYVKESFEMFNTAFDILIGAETDYNLKVDGIIRIGELLENAGDELPSDVALEFYGMAFDIFDKLSINQRAAMVEKKMELAKTVYDVGLPEIRKALLEGRNHYALALIEKKYTGVARLIGELEVALWLKGMNSPEYLDVIERAFERSEGSVFTQASIQKIASLLTKLGNLRRALKFVMEIRNPKIQSDALRAIAVELAKKREFEEARKIVNAIPDPEIRAEAMTEVVAIEESR